MNIGIVGPVNPSEFKSYFPECETPEMFMNASAVIALVKSFLDAGHNVSVFCINNNSNRYKEFISEQLKIYAVPFRLVPNTSIFKAYAIYQMKKCIKKHLTELDVLHAQWTYEYAYSAKSFAKKIPVFCTVRDWCPYIMTMFRSPFYKKVEWKVNYFLFLRVMKCSNMHFIANSEYTYSRIKTDFPNKNVVVIPNSIKKEYILYNRKKPKGEIKLVSIANGVLDPRKNIVNLLRAFKLLRSKYSDATLTIVGRYQKENPIFENWEKEGLLNGVVAKGQLAHEDVLATIDKSTMLVHPSLEETFGNILLEAMARRVPVIGGRESGAVPKVLGNGKFGICCDVTSPDSIHQAILSLLDDKNEEKIVNSATQHLINTYASDVVCEKHLQEYLKYIKSIN